MPLDLTEHQQEFFLSNSPETALVTGFGGGKSFILIARMIATKLMYPTINLGYISPTHSITRDVLYPLVDEMLSPTSIRYKINKTSNNIEFTDRGTVLCRSADDPGKIVGWTVGDMFIDEIDTLSADKAQLVWNKALGRMRAKFPETEEHPKGKRNQIFTTCTPEGFRFLWKHFKKEPEQNKKARKGRNLIQASTRDNPYLPDGFIETMEDNYPQELIDAYLDGQFVSLNAGRVYKHYDPERHSSTLTLENTQQASPPIYVGQDFNYDGSVSILMVKIDDSFHAIKEVVSKDTYDIVKNIKKLNTTNRPIIFYPDASGHQRSTSSTKTDIQIIKQGGFRVKAPRKNPDVRDRVNSVNSLYAKDRLFINPVTCPETHSAALQQIYNDKTGLPEKYNTPASIDDYNDAVGYPVHNVFPFKRPRLYHGKLGGL